MNSTQEAPRETGQATGAPYSAPSGSRGAYYREESRYKSPALATILSLMPGLGQIYVGYYQQGFINVLVVASLITLLARGETPLTPLLAMFLAFFWLYNLVDATRKATFYNQALAGLGPADLPAGFQAPSSRGALFGGILMIVAGTLAFAHLQYGMSLEWLERWWPIALVLTGAYLIYQSWAAKKK